MGSIANPMFSGLVPGGNPTGNQLSLLNMLPTGSRGTNTVLPQTASTNPSSSVVTNPYDIISSSASTSPVFPANAGPYSTSLNLGTAGGQSGTQFGGFLSGMTQKDIGRLFGDLKKTYGDGMAHLILDFLQGGAGYNQQAVNNLLASLQPGIERGEEDLVSQFSALGNRFGSGAQIGLGDYLSRVNLNEGELVTQMYEDALNRFMDVMLGTAGAGAQRKASSPGFFDKIGSVLGLAGSAAQGLQAAGVGGGSGALSSLLSGIAGAGAFCWVASEIYGGWHARETIVIRSWLLRTWYMQPFVMFYRKFGRKWASWIRKNRAARLWTMRLFDFFLKKAMMDCRA